MGRSQPYQRGSIVQGFRIGTYRVNQRDLWVWPERAPKDQQWLFYCLLPFLCSWMNSSTPPSPRLALVPVSISPEDNWLPILEASHQVVLYNPASHALTVTKARASSVDVSPSPGPSSPILRPQKDRNCPYCHRPLLDSTHEDRSSQYHQGEETSRVANYFHLLAAANESSTPATPLEQPSDEIPFNESTMAQGYFQAFFREVRRLGMGANGTVLLCEHVLDSNSLGEPDLSPNYP